ncbi:GntR family transcriptional regulator [Achromobacter anxifer]|uniref:GntR family transcriptional regulator n=1 Tax=Achromobacter anxifer TaxID=1287737 RepID=UPI0023F9DB5F|nr:GntR family transcriptional regulator [Achromobacter anxifer]MDF8362642.1 GntR family transcriptional regulator [Achromobacter anxifer]
MTQAFPLFGRTAVSQTEKAYCALEEMIVTGELPPGSQWSETTLSERVGIGRSPVRDALQKLAFQRLVEIAPRQGIFISEIDYQGQLKIIQARREIERLIVAQAAQWADDAERAELARLARELEELKAINDMRMYMRLHFALTSQIGAAARNSYAAEFHAMLQTLARRFLYFHQKRHPDLIQICELHIQQINAIVEGSVERAIATAEARNDYAENLARNILMELIVTSAVTISKPPRGKSGAD